MTLEQFTATRRWSDDLAKDAPDDCWDENTNVGHVYGPGLYIEQVQPDWPNNAGERGQWYLRIANLEWISDDLTALERTLYDWAMAEGYGEEAA